MKKVTVPKSPASSYSSKNRGLPMNPLTKMKLTNGVPGFKRGGNIKKSKPK